MRTIHLFNLSTPPTAIFISMFLYCIDVSIVCLHATYQLGMGKVFYFLDESCWSDHLVYFCFLRMAYQVIYPWLRTACQTRIDLVSGLWIMIVHDPENKNGLWRNICHRNYFSPCCRVLKSVRNALCL